MVHAKHSNPVKAALELKANYLVALYRFTHTAPVQKAHENGLKILVWTINTAGSNNKTASSILHSEALFQTMRVRSSVRLEHRTLNPSNTNNHSFNDVNWVSFHEWLQRKGFSKQYARDMFHYAQKYSSCLMEGNLSSIEGMKAERQTMASLANLSKFLGKYQDWKTLRLQFNLKWKQSVSSESVFMNLYNGKYEIHEMLKWMLEVKQKLPYEYFFPLAYNALTGLREVEMTNSLNKISSLGLEGYPFNEDMGVLEHFREPTKFFRHNKKVYISALTPKLVEHLKEWHTQTSYSKLKCKLSRSGIKDQMKGLRKWYGTTLRMAGLPSEFVDLMQGRVSQDVFVKSYFRYDLKDLIGKARTVLSEYEGVWLGESPNSIS